MLIKKLRITNYKSIIDSKWIPLENKVTIFIGKNESGKSNILKALQSINKLENTKDLCPNHDERYNPVIEFSAELNDGDIAEINKTLGFDAKIAHLDFTIKATGGNTVAWNPEVNIATKEQFTREFNEEMKTQYKFTFEEKEIEKFDSVEDTLKTQYVTKYKSLVTKSKTVTQKLVDKCFAMIPKITYLSQMTNKLPQSITTANMTTQPVKSLASFLKKESKGDIPENIFEIILGLPETSAQEKKSKCDSVSKLLTKFFKENYTQYSLRFDIAPIGAGIHIYVKDFSPATIDQESDEGQGLYLDDRSTGLNWYVSFIITCNSFDADEVFVLDEPGMNLHLEGQYDMLERLKKLSEERQIVICTHSPYLIDANELQTVRLVEKSKTTLGRAYFEETLVHPNLHCYKDAGTIQTLLHAIGYSITRGLTFHSQKALIVEGISDLLLVKAFFAKLNKPIDFDIFYAKTSTKMELMDSTLLGLGARKIVLLYDADSAGLKTYRDIEYKQVNSVFTHDIPDNVLNDKTKALTSQQAIEDILSKNDFLKFYLNRNNQFFDTTKSCSQMAKDKGSKYLDSKVFLDKIATFDFEEETVTRMTALVNKIIDKFENYVTA